MNTYIVTFHGRRLDSREPYGRQIKDSIDARSPGHARRLVYARFERVLGLVIRRVGGSVSYSQKTPWGQSGLVARGLQ